MALYPLSTLSMLPTTAPSIATTETASSSITTPSVPPTMVPSTSPVMVHLMPTCAVDYSNDAVDACRLLYTYLTGKGNAVHQN